jgi:hypothetical protein
VREIDERIGHSHNSVENAPRSLVAIRLDIFLSSAGAYSLSTNRCRGGRESSKAIDEQLSKLKNFPAEARKV